MTCQSLQVRERDQRERAENEEADAKLARDNERVQRERVETSLYFNQIARAHREWQSGKLRNAVQILDECSEPKRDWEWHYLHRLCDSSEKTMRGHSASVRRAQISPNGKWIASASSRWNDRRPGEVILWNRASGKPVHLVGRQPFGVRQIDFSPDSRLLTAVNNSQGGVGVWDVETGSTLFAHANRSFENVCFHPDGKSIAAAGVDGRIHLYDANTGRSIRVFGDVSSHLFDVAFHPSGDRIAAVTQSGVLYVWDSASGKLQHRFEGAGNRTLDFSPDNQQVAFAGGLNLSAPGRGRQTVQLWQLPEEGDRELKGELVGLEQWMSSLVYSPDGMLRVSDSRTGKLLQDWTAHATRINCVQRHPTLDLIASAGEDGYVKLWDLKSAAQMQLETPSKNVALTYVAFSADGSALATGDADGSIQLWESAGMAGGIAGDVDVGLVPHYKHIHTLAAHKERVVGLSFHPQGTRLASLGIDGSVVLWDTDTKHEAIRMRPIGQNEHVLAIAFSPDGHRLIASRSNHVSHWNAAPRKLGNLTSQEDQALAWHRRQIDSCSRQDNWFGVRFHCDLLLESEPDDAAVLASRGAAFAAQGDWKIAIKDCSRASELGANQIDNQYCLALVQLQLGDIEGYRGTCRTVLASLIDSSSDSRFNIIWSHEFADWPQTQCKT